MFELLTLGRGGGETYPDSGPGTKILRLGNLEAGFFGEVSPSEMFTTAQLSERLPFTLGLVSEQFPIWLKFAYKGKFLFIAKTPLRRGVSWLDLYNAGLVYGTNDNGPLAASIPQNNVNQLRVVEKNEHRFLARLMRNQETDPYGGNGSYMDTNWTADTEWHKLFYKISASTTSAQVGAKWGKYTDGELGLSFYSICQEHSGSLTDVLNRIGMTMVQTLAKSNQHESIAWRPVLELLPSDYMLADNNLSYTTDVNLKPISLPTAIVITEESDVLPIGDVTAANDLTDPILADGTLTYLVSDPILPISNPTISGATDEMLFIPATVQVDASIEDDVLRDSTLVYRTDTPLAPSGLSGKPAQYELFPPATITWKVQEDAVDITTIIKTTILDGLHRN